MLFRSIMFIERDKLSRFEVVALLGCAVGDLLTGEVVELLGCGVGDLLTGAVGDLLTGED